jgi:ATP-dependent exoDNAse (exonuclease V) beta subunit
MERKKNSWGKPDYGDLNRHFKSNGIKLQFIGSGYGSLSDAEQNKEAILMTYHSSKGLDFDNVFLPFLNTHFLFTSKQCRNFVYGGNDKKQKKSLSNILWLYS